MELYNAIIGQSEPLFCSSELDSILRLSTQGYIVSVFFLFSFLIILIVISYPTIIIERWSLLRIRVPTLPHSHKSITNICSTVKFTNCTLLPLEKPQLASFRGCKLLPIIDKIYITNWACANA